MIDNILASPLVSIYLVPLICTSLFKRIRVNANAELLRAARSKF